MSINTRGHNFYVINFPKAGKTWAYDGTTGLWHQRALFKDGAFYQHPALYHAMWQGKHVFAHADKVLLMGIGKNSRDMIGDETLQQVRERHHTPPVARKAWLGITA